MYYMSSVFMFSVIYSFHQKKTDRRRQSISSSCISNLTKVEKWAKSPSPAAQPKGRAPASQASQRDQMRDER